MALIPHQIDPSRALGAASMSSGILNVFPHVKYSAKIAISMSTDPTKVYKKNFIAAYSRWGPPHIPMRKYMGKSINSQKTKNKKKSKARNTPIIPVSRSRNKAKYPFTPLSIFQLTKMHKNESNGVRIIIGRLNPSTPRA